MLLHSIRQLQYWYRIVGHLSGLDYVLFCCLTFRCSPLLFSRTVHHMYCPSTVVPWFIDDIRTPAYIALFPVSPTGIVASALAG